MIEKINKNKVFVKWTVIEQWIEVFVVRHFTKNFVLNNFLHHESKITNSFINIQFFFIDIDENFVSFYETYYIDYKIEVKI